MNEGAGLFARGRAATTIADNRFAASMLAGNADPIVRKNIGFATLTSVPWYGGGSFVIWRHTQGYPEREWAAVQLVKYLTGKEAQIRWAREVRSMPARSEVLADIYPPENPLSQAITSAAKSGRAYHAVPLWRRLEYQIGQSLNACWREARENLSMDLDTILHNQLDPLAERLNLTLKG
jgi:ABC-type glycerol-3-phosphate transport system substrate-binding protein